MNYRFGLKKLPELGQIKVGLKSKFGLKPLKVEEVKKVEEVITAMGFILKYACDFVDNNFSGYYRFLFDGNELFMMNGNDPNSSIPFAVFNRNTGAYLRKATGESTCGCYDMCIFNDHIWLSNNIRTGIYEYDKSGNFVSSHGALCTNMQATLTADNVNNILYVHCAGYLKSYDTSLTQLQSASIGNAGCYIQYLDGKIFVLLTDQVIIYNATTLASEGSFGLGQFGDSTQNFFTDGTYLYVYYAVYGDPSVYPIKVFDSSGNLITILPNLAPDQNWIFGKDSNGYWLRYNTDNGSGGCFNLE